MCAPPTCARCCTFFSLVGIVFLIFAGILFDNQPEFIKGAPDNSSRAAENCYFAALIYFFLMLFSIGYWYYDERRKQRTYGAWHKEDDEARALRARVGLQTGYGTSAAGVVGSPTEK